MILLLKKVRYTQKKIFINMLTGINLTMKINTKSTMKIIFKSFLILKVKELVLLVTYSFEQTF